MKVKKDVGNLFINNAVFNNFSNATAMGEDIDNNDIKLARIEIVGDARTYHSYGNQVIEGISFNDESRIADEYSNDEILAIPHREMKSFTNTKLLDRIATIDKELLTLQQRRLLRQEYSQKYTISKKQLRNILQQIKDCDDIYFISRECYDNFLSKYNLKQRDCRYVIKALNIEDYYKAFDHVAVLTDEKSKSTITERYNMNLKENSNRYRRVKRALFGDPTGKIKTFAIIAVENPLGWKDSTEEEFKQQYAKWTQVPQKYNKERLDKIKSTEILHKIENNGNTVMKYGGYNYVQIKGKFREKYEKSFIIFNIPLVDAKAIAGGYGQLSFWWGKVSNNENEPSSIGYYETNNACVTYKLVAVSNTIVSMDDADDMFSKYGFKFKINLNYFGDEVKEPSNAREFEESLEEEHSTFMSRAIHRRRAYKDSDKNKGVTESVSKRKSEVPERIAKYFRDSIEQEDFINLKDFMKYIYRFVNINNPTEFDESDVQSAFEEIEILPECYDEEVYEDYEEFEDEWNGALRELYDICDYYRVFIPTITESNDRYIEERLLKEDEEEEVVLYDDDGSKIVLDKEALEMIPCVSTNIEDLMKELFGG